MAKGLNEMSSQKKVNPSNIKSCTIFVKNLPYNTNEDEVGDFFASCGDVDGVRLVYNSVHNHFKGFGYVDFENVDGAKKALSMNGADFGGRKLFIDIDEGKQRGGYRSRGDRSFKSRYQDEGVRKSIRKSKDYSSKSKIRNFKSKHSSRHSGPSHYTQEVY